MEPVFDVIRAKREPKPPKNIGEDEPQQGPLEWIDVSCRQCGTSWHAIAGSDAERGRFKDGHGAITINCSACDATETIPARELSRRLSMTA